MTPHQKSILKWAGTITLSGVLVVVCFLYWYNSQLDLLYSMPDTAKRVADSSLVAGGYLFVIASGLMAAMLCFLAISAWFQRANGPGAGHILATWNAAKVDLAKDLSRIKRRRVAEEEAALLDENTSQAKSESKHPARRL